MAGWKQMSRAVPHMDGLLACRWTPEQLYTVVARVEDYHKFVPWCQKSRVVKPCVNNYLEAELEVGFQLLVERCAAVRRVCGSPAGGWIGFRPQRRGGDTAAGGCVFGTGDRRRATRWPRCLCSAHSAAAVS